MLPLTQPSGKAAPCNRWPRNDGVGQVVIRNIDDRVIETLKQRAAAQRKSLEQSLRDRLTEAATPDRTELLATLATPIRDRA